MDRKYLASIHASFQPLFLNTESQVYVGFLIIILHVSLKLVRENTSIGEWIMVLFVLQLKLPILFNILLTMHLPQYYQVNPIFSNTWMILNLLPVIQNADVPTQISSASIFPEPAVSWNETCQVFW